MPDTICALATAPARAAIGVIRTSGPDAFRIAREILCYTGKNTLIEEGQTRNLSFGRIVDGDETVDEVVVCAFRAPHSYTGEDSVEYSCHGGVYLLNRVLGLLISHGARQAGPGEFTKRAFCNGKTDLVRAEGVVDLIDADHKAAARLALRALEGKLGAALGQIEEQLLSVSAQLLAFVDYPDDEIGEIDKDALKEDLQNSVTQAERLCRSYDDARLVRDGVKTVLCGKPNVGKSSILNALCGAEKAIVTPVAGTTRDVIETVALCGGCKLLLTDTAGLRETDDAVERIGVARAKDALRDADVAVCVFDETDTDYSLLRTVAAPGRKTVCLFNKSDLRTTPPCLPAEFTPDAVFSVSAVTGQGMDDFAAYFAATFGDGRCQSGETLLNQRQQACLVRVTEALKRALDALSYSYDAVLMELESALSALGELTGKSVSESIVNEIFSRFCVGK